MCQRFVLWITQHGGVTEWQRARGIQFSTQQCLKVMRVLCSCSAEFWEVIFSDVLRIALRDVFSSQNIPLVGPF